MKKIFVTVLSAALLLVGTQANAQLSVGAGYLNSAESTAYNGGDPDKDNLNGFYVGVNYNIPIVAGLGVAPGLYASGLFYGSNGSDSFAGITASGKFGYSEIALNVPVNVNYKFNLSRDLDMFVYGGPIFQYGLVSKTSGEISGSLFGISVSTGKQENNEYGENGSRNPFNIYLGGGVGIDVAGIQVILGYDHSLTNISKVDKVSTGRSQIKIGVGYAF